VYELLIDGASAKKLFDYLCPALFARQASARGTGGEPIGNSL